MSDHYFLAMKSNADTGNLKAVKYMTSANYSALSAKDANTLYLSDFGNLPPLSSDTLDAKGATLYWKMSNTGGNVLSNASVSGETLTLTKVVKADGSSTVTTTSVTFTPTHWTTHLYLTNTSTAGSNVASSANPYLNLFDNTTLRSAIQVIGSDGAETSSDASGHLTIEAPGAYYATASFTAASNISSASLVAKYSASSKVGFIEGTFTIATAISRLKMAAITSALSLTSWLGSVTKTFSFIGKNKTADRDVSLCLDVSGGSATLWCSSASVGDVIYFEAYL